MAEVSYGLARQKVHPHQPLNLSRHQNSLQPNKTNPSKSNGHQNLPSPALSAAS
jgi:hypothetical protein